MKDLREKKYRKNLDNLKYEKWYFLGVILCSPAELTSIWEEYHWTSIVLHKITSQKIVLFTVTILDAKPLQLLKVSFTLCTHIIMQSLLFFYFVLVLKA
jgi:hypothetical protein